jgi:hypothetical protein
MDLQPLEILRDSVLSPRRVTRHDAGIWSTNALRSTLQIGEYSDFTISTPEREFKVHKCVISLKSPFFRAACSGGFKARSLMRLLN